MSSDAKDVVNVLGDESATAPRVDRQGLDLLATVVDEVAADLPEPTLVPWPPSHGREVTAGHRPVWLAAAAVLAAMVLAWPLYLGLVRLPRVTAELEAVKSPRFSAPADGPVELRWLSPPRGGSRAGGESLPERVEKRAGRSTVWLLEVPVDQRARLADGALVEMTRDGAPLSWNLDMATLKRQLDAQDGVTILVQDDALSLGSQRLRLLDVAGQEVVTVELLVVAEDHEP